MTEFPIAPKGVITRDGRLSMKAHLSLGGNQITHLGTGVTADEGVNVGQMTGLLGTGYVPYSGASSDVNLGTHLISIGTGTGNANGVNLGQLTNSLTAYVPYTGATSDVYLGNHSIECSIVSFYGTTVAALTRDTLSTDRLWTMPDINGKVQLRQKAHTIQTTNYTITTSDEVIIMNAKNLTATLPSALDSGRMHYIKNIYNGDLVLKGSGAETIDGVNAWTMSHYDCIQVIDYGTGVWIIA